MNKLKNPVFLLLLCGCIISCSKSFLPIKAEYDSYRITAQLPKDSGMLQWLKPYSDSMNKSMDVIVGVAENNLEQKRPEGTLGNFMADMMYSAAKEKFGVVPDAAFVNYGAIRITQLPKGEVTRGKIFELMPFDNLVVLQRMKGSVLQEFLDFTAAAGGWPSAGIAMQIKGNKALNVKIGGQPIDFNKTYIIVNSDYVANGGDNATMLKTIPQENIGYVMRDAIFDYIALLKAQGKNISANEENRVTNAQ